MPPLRLVAPSTPTGKLPCRASVCKSPRRLGTGIPNCSSGHYSKKIRIPGESRDPFFNGSVAG